MKHLEKIKMKDQSTTVWKIINAKKYRMKEIEGEMSIR